MVWSDGRLKLHVVEFVKWVKAACSPWLARLAAISERIRPKQPLSSTPWSPCIFTICWLLERGRGKRGHVHPWPEGKPSATVRGRSLATGGVKGIGRVGGRVIVKLHHRETSGCVAGESASCKA
jgi:hypothetical protein